MSDLIRQIWRATGEPVYNRLFRRYYVAAIERLNILLAEVGGLRAEVKTLNERVERLDTHTRNALADRWERVALARRLASIEDRLEANGHGGRPELANPPEADRDATSP